MMKRIKEGHVIRSSYDAVGDMDDGRPANSVVYTDETDNNAIVAWVHMLQLIQNGTWESVDMDTYLQMNRIFLERKILWIMTQSGYLTDRNPPMCPR